MPAIRPTFHRTTVDQISCCVRRINVLSRCVQRCVHLSVSKDNCLMDEDVDITVSGLKSRQKVTIIATVQEDRKFFWSHGNFQADDAGTVNVSKTSPISGSYKGCDSAGLFWSMQLAPWVPKGLRLAKLKADTPHTYQLSVYEATSDPAQKLKDDGQKLASIYHNRWYKADNVKRIPLDHPRFRGTLFIPDGTGPFPGIIDMFGGLILLMESRAALLASRGFATLSLSYVHGKDLPKTLVDIELSYFEDVAQWFSSLPDVRSEGIGVVGLCLGGQLATWMAEHIPNVRAVVNLNGCPYVIPTWTHRGKHEEDCHTNYSQEHIFLNDEGVVIKDAMVYEKSDLRKPWKHGAKMLTLVSGDDMMVHNRVHYDLHSSIPTEFKSNAQLIFYAGAGHLIEPPYTPLHRSVDCGEMMSNSGFVPEKFHKEHFVTGGYPEEHAVAQKDGWEKILQFLRKHLM